MLSFRGSKTIEESRKTLKIFLDSSLYSEWQARHTRFLVDLRKLCYNQNDTWK